MRHFSPSLLWNDCLSYTINWANLLMLGKHSGGQMKQFSFRSIYASERGTSVLAVMIFAALSVLIIGGISQKLFHARQKNVDHVQRDTYELFVQNLKVLLEDPQACTHLFRGMQIGTTPGWEGRVDPGQGLDVDFDNSLVNNLIPNWAGDSGALINNRTVESNDKTGYFVVDDIRLKNIGVSDGSGGTRRVADVRPWGQRDSTFVYPMRVTVPVSNLRVSLQELPATYVQGSNITQAEYNSILGNKETFEGSNPLKKTYLETKLMMAVDSNARVQRCFGYNTAAAVCIASGGTYEWGGTGGARCRPDKRCFVDTVQGGGVRFVSNPSQCRAGYEGVLIGRVPSGNSQGQSLGSLQAALQAAQNRLSTVSRRNSGGEEFPQSVIQAAQARVRAAQQALNRARSSSSSNNLGQERWMCTLCHQYAGMDSLNAPPANNDPDATELNDDDLKALLIQIATQILAYQNQGVDPTNPPPALLDLVAEWNYVIQVAASNEGINLDQLTQEFLAADQLVTARDALQTQLNSINNQVQQAQSQMGSYPQQEAAAQQAVVDAQAALDSAQQVLDHVSQTNSQGTQGSQAQIDAAQAQVTAAQQALSDSQAALQNLQDQNVQATRQLASLTTQQSQIQSQFNDAQQAVDSGNAQETADPINAILTELLTEHGIDTTLLDYIDIVNDGAA